MPMRDLPTVRRREQPLSSLVRWKDLVDADAGVLSTKHPGYLCIYRVKPPDLGSLSESAQGAITLQLNEAWKALPSSGSALWQHVRRRPVTTYHPTDWPDPVAGVIDREHGKALVTPGRSWGTEVFLSLWCRSSAPGRRRKPRWSWFDHGSIMQTDRRLEAFQAQVEHVMSHVRLVCPRIERFNGGAVLTYLHSLISVYDQPLFAPEIGLDVDTLTADCGFWPGSVPILGDWAKKEYVRLLTLHRDLPSETVMALFRGLNRLDFSFDVTTRWIPMAREKAQKMTTTTQINWLSSQKSWRAWLYEARTGEKTDNLDRHTTKQASDADAIRDAVLSGEYALGHLTMTFLVRDEDLERANANLDRLGTLVRQAGCKAVDDPWNATDAFVATWPGELVANVDRLDVTTHNLATLQLWHVPWSGVEHNPHLQSRPLCYARTEGSMLFGVETFVEDLGNAMLVGPMGAGKSTALNFFGAQWRCEPSRQLFTWDVGRSSRCMTLCFGGGYHDLGVGDVGLQILDGVDDVRLVPFIYEWLVHRVRDAGLPWHPDVGTYLRGGLDSLRANRSIPRRLYAYLDVLTAHSNKFAALAGSQQHKRSEHLSLLAPVVREALRPFAQGGIYGHLTDAPRDELALKAVHTFELGTLLKMQEVYPAVLELVFYRLAQRCDGRPTRFHFDEAWHYFSHPTFLKILAEEMPGWRKANISAIFSTQSISQLLDNRLTPLLMASCQTRMLLPDAKALDAEVREAYLGMGLGEDEIHRNIVMARSKDECYITRPDDQDGRPQRRLISLRLERVAPAICGANRAEDHAAMDEILAKRPAEEFSIHWLAHKGFHDEAREVAEALDHSLAMVADA